MHVARLFDDLVADVLAEQQCAQQAFTGTLSDTDGPLAIKASVTSLLQRDVEWSEEATLEFLDKYLKRGSVKLTLTTNYAARFNVADTGYANPALEPTARRR